MGLLKPLLIAPGRESKDRDDHKSDLRSQVVEVHIFHAEKVVCCLKRTPSPAGWSLIVTSPLARA